MKRKEREEEEGRLKNDRHRDLEPSSGGGGGVAVEEGSETGQETSHRSLDKASNPSTLYLDSINRHFLDFDFERLCVVSLSNINVYACLVCGRYYQGRGPSTPCYHHAINTNHHVFIHLETLKVYILPDGNEVKDSSLSDIKYALSPTYTPQQIADLDSKHIVAIDLQGKSYIPGFVGLNNIKANDYINVVMQALNQVKPIRDYFLLSPQSNPDQQLAVSSHASKYAELVKRFGSLLRKLWNPRAFKGHVSPHELLQEIVQSSGKKFKPTQQANIVEFVSWFLNSLHVGLGGTKRPGSSLIHRAFQGEVCIETLCLDREGGDPERMVVESVSHSPFLLLTLNLPPTPLFQAEVEKYIIPQVSLLDLLRKYDGQTIEEGAVSSKRYHITRLPRYLIFQFTRFTKNNWTSEKNRTIVNFPIRGIDMRDYLSPEAQARYQGSTTVYDLVANICHESLDTAAATAAADTGGAKSSQDKNQPAMAGTFSVHVHSKATNTWFQMQDLLVKEIMPQMIFLSPSYLMVWELRED